MSANINQIFQANPITSNTSTDLMYFGQSPYGGTDNAAMIAIAAYYKFLKHDFAKLDASPYARRIKD